jgi:hypothetical protein
MILPSRVAGNVDHLQSDREDGIRLDDHAVESQLHPALSDEVPRILVVFEAADQVAVIGKNGASIALGGAGFT